MTFLVPALAGVLVGAAIAAVLAWLVVRRPVDEARRAALTAQHVEAIIDNLWTAAAVVDASGTVIAASRAARACGLVRSTSIAQPAARSLVEHVRGGGGPAELEVTLSRDDQAAPLTLDLRAEAAPGGMVVLVGEDRSADRRNTQTRRDFVANTSHELKTPIGAITLLAEAVESAADDPAAVRDFAGRLSAETARLADLVAQLMALSQLESEEAVPDAVPVDVREVAERAVNRCRERAARARISIRMAGDDGCLVAGDATQLEAAVTNLVENAIAYSEEGSSVAVSVRATPDGETVEIRVSDHGIGIAEADQARIFERFYRVDPGRSRASGGTGLGLSIVKHTAFVHGGEVSVWSKPGQGSTFTLRLPRLTEGAGR